VSKLLSHGWGQAQFVVYLQANFQHSPGAHLKQRFVLAHEICHALLYERIDANKIRRRRMGEAERESLCNRGAGWLVLPEFVVDWFVQRNGRIRTTEQILALATDAQVSLETVIRRLHENPSKWLEVDHGFVLAQAHAEVPTIRAVAYGPWMWGKIPVPQLYQAEKDWISKLRFDHDLVEGSETTIHLNPGILRLEKAHPRSSSYVYKIRHEAG